ncbi:RNA polymerase sigma factor [Rossellomorea aquimaris]|uniref:RNA polymerase sigma factor n=1 Tax=Rossellomorea aquimaris TaxID=189382 RepID=UPI001CD4EE4E|nr:RNA polymerase sigma factor [Rossellomorea aquimaris]MCA1057224.1 RNA polymerase sigma factor [Rossellomorea aquimaris]
MDESQLIEKAKHGDLTAYSQLIRDYSPIVERFAYQMGNNIDDIQDISQEVFIRVYRFLDGFTHAKFSTWLYKITLNVSKDFKRKDRQYTKRIQKVMNEPREEPSHDHKHFIREEEDRVLHECIQMLDEKYRVPIILYYFHEKKYEEMAAILAINLSTLKTRLLRGKSLLKKMLEEAERGEGKENG